MADIEWILLRSFTDNLQAKMLGQFLEKQGVPVSVEGAFTADVLPLHAGVLGTRVMVPADRIAEAREAAEAFDGQPSD